MPEAAPLSLSIRDLTVSVPGRRLITGLSLAVSAGEFVAVLGPNGVGKSLLLHTLAGIRPALHGTISIAGEDVATLGRQPLAARLALLPQYTEDIFPATAFDTVMIGRHPHIGRFRWESEEDRRIARRALDAVKLGPLAERDVLTLSGGERRRLAVAQILTQDTGICLLDEPTNHLDPQHQLDVLRLFADRARHGRTIVTSLHDINLAARFADRCLLLYGDGRWETGETSSLLTAARMAALYDTPMETVAWRDKTLFVAAGSDGNRP